MGGRLTCDRNTSPAYVLPRADGALAGEPVREYRAHLGLGGGGGFRVRSHFGGKPKGGWVPLQFQQEDEENEGRRRRAGRTSLNSSSIAGGELIDAAVIKMDRAMA